MTPDSGTGRYRLLERLTPDSEVWHAEDLEDPATQIVIKILPEGSDAITARHLIETLEDSAMPELNVPKDEGELPDGRPFLVYPYVEGSTLRDWLNASGPLPLTTAGVLIRQMGKALAALHAKQFIYGSLAAEHVIVQHSHGRHGVVLLNAGAYRVAGQTSASPGYLAPEQLAGSAVFSSDIYALAILAAEMVTGRRPFRYGSLNELQHLQRIGIARGALRKLRSKVPLRAEEEIRRATSWDVAHRPSDVETFAGRLGEALGATGGIPARRLILGGLLAAALAVTGLRRCNRR